MKLVNNTFVGGQDPLAFYVDKRSTPGCSVPNSGCTAIYGPSDWDLARPSIPPTLDWMTRLDLSINNIVLKTNTGNKRYCSVPAPFCLMQKNESGYSAITTQIHKADSLRPQTYMNNNIYGMASGNIVGTGEAGNHSTIAAFSSYLAGSPVGIAGLEANSKSGAGLVDSDGSITSATNHNQAISLPSGLSGKVPADTITEIMQYINANTQHFGVTTK